MSNNTLQATVREIVDRAFSEGAQWACVFRHGEDSAKVGRELNGWTQHATYKSLVSLQQRKAEEQISRVLMRMATDVQARLL